MSRQFDAAIRALDAGASGSAYAFGEECVSADGTRTFYTMETDFRARALVRDLKDEETMGNWISHVMQIVDSLPSASVPGAHPGRVELEFYQNQTGGLRINVDITRYRNEGLGASGARLFQLFQPAQ